MVGPASRRRSHIFEGARPGDFSVRLAHPNLDSHHAPSPASAQAASDRLSSALRCAVSPAGAGPPDPGAVGQWHECGLG